MKYTAVVKEGKLKMSDYGRDVFTQFLQKNNGARIELTPVLPESQKLRNWFEGAVIPVVTYYQEGLDHRNHEDRAKVREWLKQEFNGETVVIAERQHVIAKSTKGRPELNKFVERVLDWLVPNYQPPEEALNPDKYKEWRDTIYPSGGPADPDNFISYLVSIGILK